MKRDRLLPWLLALAACGCQTVPYTGRNHLLLISAAEEKSMGEEAYRDTLKKSKLSSDPEKVQMIRRVGHRLAKAADKPDYQWEFNLIEDDKQINAWCLPGGKVAFYTALLPVAHDEDGVAVVMGHEISHALARHGGERMSQGLLANIGGQALSVLLANRDPGAQNAVNQAYGLGVGLGVLLPFSRAQESEADHIGLILMAKAGYDPKKAVEFWGRMAKATGGKGDGGLGKYLGTHPPNQERIDQIRQWLPEAEKYFHPGD